MFISVCSMQYYPQPNISVSNHGPPYSTKAKTTDCTANMEYLWFMFGEIPLRRLIVIDPCLLICQAGFFLPQVLKTCLKEHSYLRRHTDETIIKSKTATTINEQQ